MEKQNFKLKYAPHFGSFKHHAGTDFLDQLRFAADLGFTAFEDNAFSGVPIPDLMGIGMLGQEEAFLDKIANTMMQLGIEMGTFVMGPVNWPPNAAFTSGAIGLRDKFLEKCRRSVAVGQRLNARYVTVVPDAADNSLPVEVQTANVVEALKYGAELFEKAGMVMLLEPLSFPPQVFLKTSAQAYLLAKSVNSPSCKILFDVFHLQQNEGFLTKNIDLVWDEIGYFQLGSVPNRFEPGTGEVNHKHLLNHIHKKAKEKGQEFFFGMEHYNSKEGKAGEAQMIQAYLQMDSELTAL